MDRKASKWTERDLAVEHGEVAEVDFRVEISSKQRENKIRCAVDVQSDVQ